MTLNSHQHSTNSICMLGVTAAITILAAGSGCSMHTAATAPQTQNTATAKPVATPTTTTAHARPARQFDPFWIEAAAEADRAIWLGYPADPAGPAASGGEILASQTSDMRLPVDERGANFGDHVEGLTHCTFASEGADFDPCISRDGSFMVFASTQHRPTADIYRKSINGRTITQLTSDAAHDLMPAISPDGQRIAFASDRGGNWDIYVMAATGGQAVQLSTDPAQEVHPSWSPDGKRLVFSRHGEMSGRWEMWVMEVSASANTEFLGYGLFPKWCPRTGTGADGRDKILFQRSRERGDRAFGLWTIDYKPGDASSPTEVASTSIAALINADWSPEGDRIVYASVDNPGDAGDMSPRPAVADLWMTNIDGSGRVNLTSGRFMNLMPAWSKDGRIYFVSNRSGMTNIWSMGTDKAIYAASGAATKPATQPTTDMATVPDAAETADETGN
ncbi:MAG: PD40 domain-containing protein [Phycisphaerales bacterium]|nr:PD40 domain-containing protein [Phycisphaerales bacterium]